ncbi:MAG: hypothetical protein O7D91_00730, partial [Planctomycetota bacterium]|nr:hypothetical protein [Planctomycetota bacterium]
ILSRLVDPNSPTFPADAAKGILSLKFPQDDVDRMKELAEKARKGALTPEEQAQADSYERIGNFLGLLHSKARISLKKSDGDQSEPS